MVNEKIGNITKILFRFSKILKNGARLSFRWEQLPGFLFEEFVEFKMEHFVKHETIRIAAGIHKNSEALEEYRQGVLKLYKDPSYCIAICRVDDESERIVAAKSSKLYRIGDTYNNLMPAQTAEMKKYNQIMNKRNSHLALSDVLVKNGVNKIFDDAGFAIHADYRGYDFFTEIALFFPILCKAHAVPLAGTWISSATMQKAAARDNWNTVCEVSTESLEKTCGVKFHNAPKNFEYRVKRINN